MASPPNTDIQQGGMSHFFKNFFAFFFCSPFRGIPFLIWAFFYFTFVVHPNSPIWHYNLVDNDDYLYLVQAMDWVKGQPWFDRLQHRIDPPTGAIVYFSPLMNLVYGLPTLLLSRFYNLVDAATLTSIFYPALYLALFLWALGILGTDIIGKDWGKFTAFVALFCFTVMLQFTPGRVDHHGLEQAVAVTSLILIYRMIMRPDVKRWPVMAGILLAFGLTIALEILPYFLIVTSWVGFWAVIEGRKQARNACLFAASLFISSLLFLLISWPPAQLLTVDVGVYSVVYVSLCLGILVCYLAVWATSHVAKTLNRLIAAAICATIVGVVFAYLFPDILHGPFADSDPEVVKTIFAHSAEAWPLLMGGPLTRSVCLPALAIIAQLAYLYRKPFRQEWTNWLLLILISVMYAMSIFMQQRMMMYTESIAIIPLTRLCRDTWTVTTKWNDALSRRAVRIAVLLLVGPLTTVIYPAFANKDAPAVDTVLFPVQMPVKICDENGLVAALNTTYGDHPLVIMNTMGQSMELLFRTPHKVITSPFHTNTQGNLDSYTFFTTTNADDARQIAAKHPFDIVVMCKVLEDLYVTPVLHDDVTTTDSTTFAKQLSEGQVPDWLTPIDNPTFGNMLLFKVNPLH